MTPDKNPARTAFAVALGGRIRAAARANKSDPNAHMIAVMWDAGSTAREFWPCCVELDSPEA
jgi:hypothetical protein